MQRNWFIAIAFGEILSDQVTKVGTTQSPYISIWPTVTLSLCHQRVTTTFYCSYIKNRHLLLMTKKIKKKTVYVIFLNLS